VRCVRRGRQGVREQYDRTRAAPEGTRLLRLAHDSTRAWAGMADFGEYVPLDSRPASGRSAMVEHNSYPQQWQEVNARVAAERRTTRGDEDTPLWFARSSGLTSPSVTPLFWLGDQLHSWDRRDGLASVVVALLSSGVSGHALSHSCVHALDHPRMRHRPLGRACAHAQLRRCLRVCAPRAMRSQRRGRLHHRALVVAGHPLHTLSRAAAALVGAGPLHRLLPLARRLGPGSECAAV
jgi:hypothetical protein